MLSKRLRARFKKINKYKQKRKPEKIKKSINITPKKEFNLEKIQGLIKEL